MRAQGRVGLDVFPIVRLGTFVALMHEKIAVAPGRLDHGDLVLSAQVLAHHADRLARDLGPFDVTHPLRFIHQGRKVVQPAADARLDQPHQTVAVAVHGRQVAFGLDRGQNRPGLLLDRPVDLHPFL